MPRMFAVLALLVGLVPIARAQDMPLSQILIEGEGWNTVQGKPEKPQRVDPLGALKHNSRTPVPSSTAAVRSPSGDTIFVGHTEDDYVWAYQADARGIHGAGAPDCPLRRKRGAKGIEVTGLVCDTDGRIYAATEIGVQVFDPTGRLCGVLTPAASGKPQYMKFEGDQLSMWIGDTKYTRKLNATGAP